MPLFPSDFTETYTLMQKLVQAQCVNPPGNELKSIQIIESFLRAKGIKDIFISESVPNRANLFSKIEGSDKTADAMLLGPAHVDVVPISNVDEWIFDPFSGEIKDGFMYGRGVLDMLFIVASQVIAFCKVFNEKKKLRGDLMLLIVSDEEAGGKFGTNHFLKHHADKLNLSQHKVYAITEGGGSVLYNKLLQLRVGERGTFWKRLAFKGTPGHGAFPYMSNNAVVKASKAATRLYDYVHETMPPVIEPVKLFLESLAEFEPDITTLLDESSYNKNLQKYYEKNWKVANSLFSITHLTFSPNLVEGGNKVNTIPGMAHLDVDIRALPGQDNDYVLEHLKSALGPDLDPEITSIVDKDDVQLGSQSPATPEESKFVTAIHKSVLKELPSVKIIPSIVGGGTDSRFCRALGMDAYGFAVTNPDLKPAEIGPAHGINERIDLKSIDLTLKAYYNLIENFLT